MRWPSSIGACRCFEHDGLVRESCFSGLFSLVSLGDAGREVGIMSLPDPHLRPAAFWVLFRYQVRIGSHRHRGPTPQSGLDY